MVEGQVLFKQSDESSSEGFESEERETLSPTLEDPFQLDRPTSARSSLEEPAEDFVQHKETKNVHTRSGRQVKPFRKGNMVYYR